MAMHCVRRKILSIIAGTARKPGLLRREYSVASSGNDELICDYLESGITVLSLNRAAAKNSFGANLVNLMESSVKSLNDCQKTRVVVLRSLVPGVFCAGADLKERRKMAPQLVAPFVARLRALMSSIANLPVPTIAALDGVALGGGLEIALACDIRVAAKNITLGLVETKLAIIPGAGGTQRLARIVGPTLAKELIFTGRTLSGEEAAKFWIVGHAVEQNADKDAAFRHAMTIAGEIAQRGPKAIKMAKVAIDSGIEVDINTGLALEAACYAQLVDTKDRVEGLEAFAEKRPPRYTGQ